MIRANSPYYVTTPWLNPNGGAKEPSYTIRIFVWSGDKTDTLIPVLISQTVQNVADSDGDSRVDIAPLIKGEIEFNPITDYTSGVKTPDNQKWVRWDITYANDPTPQQEVTEIFGLGYTFGMGGENNTDFNLRVGLSSQSLTANKDGVFIIPVQSDEVNDWILEVKSFPNFEINISQTITSTITSSEWIRNLVVDLANDITNDTSLTIDYYQDGDTPPLEPTFEVFIETECRYTPIDIMLINQLGVQQTLTFFKDRQDSINVTSEVYERAFGQPANGVHQYTRYNTQARETLVLTSGFVREDLNETFKQLLLSDRVWSYEPDTDTLTPLTIQTTSNTFKTRQRERVISYDITFQLGFNTINNI